MKISGRYRGGLYAGVAACGFLVLIGATNIPADLLQAAQKDSLQRAASLEKEQLKAQTDIEKEELKQQRQSKAIRGKKPDEAKSQYEEAKHHTLPDPNPKNIDIVKAYWRDYKKSGMGERRLLGLFILLVFIGDFAATFSARNPWGRPPGEFIAMTGSNLIIMIAGEAGFILWRKTVKH